MLGEPSTGTLLLSDLLPVRHTHRCGKPDFSAVWWFPTTADPSCAVWTRTRIRKSCAGFEHYRRPDIGHSETELTVDGPEVLAKPSKHMVGKRGACGGRPRGPGVCPALAKSFPLLADTVVEGGGRAPNV